MDKKNILEEKITKEVLNDYEKFEEENTLEGLTEKKNFLTNIWKPISKIIIALIIVIVFAYIVNLQTKYNKETLSSKIEGTWIDENNNNYEVYNNKIEINQGIKDRPFYIGEITNIIETSLGMKIITKGTQISYINTDEPDKRVEKSLNLSIELKDYTEELQKPMTVKYGDNELGILRVINKKEE